VLVCSTIINNYGSRTRAGSLGPQGKAFSAPAPEGDNKAGGIAVQTLKYNGVALNVLGTAVLPSVDRRWHAQEVQWAVTPEGGVLMRWRGIAGRTAAVPYSKTAWQMVAKASLAAWRRRIEANTHDIERMPGVSEYTKLISRPTDAVFTRVLRHGGSKPDTIDRALLL